MTRSLVLTAAIGVLALILVSIWVLGGATRSSQSHEHAEPRDLSADVRSTAFEEHGSTVDPAVSEGAAADRKEMAPPGGHVAATAPTARELLESLWGPLSEEDERKLRAEGIDPDARYPIPDWAEVEGAIREQLVEKSQPPIEEQIRSRVDWEAPTTSESLARRFTIADPARPLTDSELDAVRSVADRHNETLRNLAERYASGVRSALEAKWGSGGYERSPLTTALIPRSAQRAFFAAAAGYNQWGAKIRLFADEFPELAALDREMVGVQAERNREIRQLLARR